MPNLGDHLIVALIVVAYPLYFTLEWHRRLLPRLQTGSPHSRHGFYRRSMMELWLLTPVVLVWWLGSGRALETLGLGIPGGWAFGVGLLVVLGIALGLGYQIKLIHASADARAQVRKQFQGVPGLLVPRGRRERRMWVAVSVTAGVCEEVLFRGYLIWYLMTWVPGAAAVLVSGLLFGMAHVYLGWGTGVLRGTLAGVAFGAAYLLTGTLWIPIALHTVIDITSGLIGSAGFGDAMSGTLIRKQAEGEST